MSYKSQAAWGLDADIYRRHATPMPLYKDSRLGSKKLAIAFTQVKRKGYLV
jgi:hypothetical protein